VRALPRCCRRRSAPSFWTVAAFTGKRLGELVALRWKNVDLDAATISVVELIGRGSEGAYRKTPKSRALRRIVELDDGLVVVLKAHRKAQAEKRLALGAGWSDLDLVFPEVDGTSASPNKQSRRSGDLVRRHAAACGVKVVRFHDLPHTHFTPLLDAGVRTDVVSERLGHESVAFTLQQYARRYAGDQRSGLARLRSAAR
jgi:integrase